MFIILIIVLLLCVSFLLSLLSLRIELKKNIKTEQVTDELAKGRVIFHAPSLPENGTDHEEMNQQDSLDKSNNTI